MGTYIFAIANQMLMKLILFNKFPAFLNQVGAVRFGETTYWHFNWTEDINDDDVGAFVNSLEKLLEEGVVSEDDFGILGGHSGDHCIFEERWGTPENFNLDTEYTFDYPGKPKEPECDTLFTTSATTTP